ncbi:hypothetical protein CEUSTIGMA_g13833.t1 [Chlamydomonas eustigma]|uniref:tRNA/rRNA methyltransferase SpoU type domain-containing protein n=1 Tax=Chlamydomonas eustigma TaxID=1157962 RepID=A0A250XTS9_9CHLO|nr:hypothetical protein CEUSTIGMA_g13833.t1 [Chlamydomonas eustigma]|eukprot:GAX86423.1 hypothetical protein CEUSTIGMA_g13833.t1 [Chlamydomonas eustigma]
MQALDPKEHASTSGNDQDGGPDCYVILHSVAKRHNVGTIARCATAFGVKEMCLVGSRQFNTFGSHGSDAYVDIGHYQTLELCVIQLKEEKGCEIVGVEIVEGALPVHSHPFSRSTAFMLGNEGQGLSPKQLALCDRFVYIPQHGPGTASLNVAVACSIVLHHFALWAKYDERERQGQKFVVGPRQMRTRARGVAGKPEDVRRERQERKESEEDKTEYTEGELIEGSLNGITLLDD